MPALADAPAAMPRSDHFEQLDSLRALAVLGVLIAHWIPAHERFLPVGVWGVRLFFVLSGFLITGILLRARDDAAATGASRRGVLIAFFARRFLRIFPLYYATLVLAALVNPASRRALLWFVTYTQNFLFAWQGEAPAMPHFWSLAVEEQFYLVWPWLILFTPRRWLRPLILTAIALGPVSLLLVIGVWGESAFVANVVPTSSLTTLGAGGLLALLFQAGRDHPEALRRRSKRALQVGGLLLAGVAILPHSGAATPYGIGGWLGVWFALNDLAAALAFAGLIGLATFRITGPVGWLLDQRALREVGKVSYGVYVLHLFVPAQMARLARLGLDPTVCASPLVWLVVTLGAAFTSWFVLERPVNALKRYFPYLPRSGAALGPARAGGVAWWPPGPPRVLGRFLAGRYA